MKANAATVVTKNTTASCWCFTENKESSFKRWEKFIKGETEARIEYMVYQKEKGETTSKIHLQGFIILSGKQRQSYLIKRLSQTASYRPMWSTREACRNYCMKEETRIEGPFEFGEFKQVKKGQRTDITSMKESIDNGANYETIKNDYFGLTLRYSKGIKEYIAGKVAKRNQILNIICYGLPGTGKTTWVQENYPDAFWKPTQSKWFDGYDGQKAIVYDDFNTSWFSWDYFMRLLDRFQVKAEGKGTVFELGNEVNIFTTNTDPRTWFKVDTMIKTNKTEALIRRLTKPMGKLYVFQKDEYNAEVTYKHTELREWNKVKVGELLNAADDQERNDRMQIDLNDPPAKRRKITIETVKRVTGLEEDDSYW